MMETNCVTRDVCIDKVGLIKIVFNFEILDRAPWYKTIPRGA